VCREQEIGRRIRPEFLDPKSLLCAGCTSRYSGSTSLRNAKPRWRFIGIYPHCIRGVGDVDARFHPSKGSVSTCNRVNYSGCVGIGAVPEGSSLGWCVLCFSFPPPAQTNDTVAYLGREEASMNAHHAPPLSSFVPGPCSCDGTGLAVATKRWLNHAAEDRLGSAVDNQDVAERKKHL
jgi:hypothetical protein